MIAVIIKQRRSQVNKTGELVNGTVRNIDKYFRRWLTKPFPFHSKLNKILHHNYVTISKCQVLFPSAYLKINNKFSKQKKYFR